ncbi:MAG: aminotransferase class V-fold PLP-dependent enzyme [Opitutaceae bacterium]|nr:aminotransferase class V-fold PLP-dependent enzyme [Opitutaceae bacterium]
MALPLRLGTWRGGAQSKIENRKSKIPPMPYFDHNATAPLSDAARDAWLRAQEEAWFNPASPHRGAARVRARLEAARARLAELLGAEPERVVFNSGATEGAASALDWWARTWPRDRRIAVSPVEHPCVLESARKFFAGRTAWLEVDADGAVRLDALEKLLAGGGIGGVAVMAANNETGVIQPWREIAAACRAARAAYLCDATQWLGKLPAAGLGGAAMWATGSAHKFGGPKGVGFVKLAAQAEGFCALPGGGQQRGHRGGTEDFPGAAAMVAALEAAEAETGARTFQPAFSRAGFEAEGRQPPAMPAPPWAEERLRWRAEFERAAPAAAPGARVVAAGARRLWNTVSLLMPRGEGHRWVARLDRRGFQVSTGSACATGADGPSHVLAAMRVPPDEARRVVRVSAGRETSRADWLALAEALGAVARELEETE